MEGLFENWSETKAALLEGLDAQKQKVVAPLLENQKNHMIAEAAAAGSTDAHSIAGFRKILIPMIRRIIPGTIATELVGVQPMTGPVGLVYTLRYRYAEAVSDTTHANPFNLPGAIGVGDEVFGNSSPIRQWYSSGAGTSGPLDQSAGASAIDNADTGTTGIDGEEATGLAWPSSLPSGTGTGANSGANQILGGSGSFIEGSGGRKMTMDVVSQAVEAGSRKLQAGWTIEAMQDLNAQHGLDLESEMTQALSAEIVQEIDQEIITDLLALAGTVDTFDGAGAGVYGAGGNYKPAFIGDRLANIAVIINRVANEIARKTRRGAGNFIVVSPMIVSVLQSAAKSVFAPAVEGSFKGPNNTMLVGTLNGTIKVYSYLWNQVGAGLDLGTAGASPLVQADDIMLVGYKGGNGETDTGYFYCPYIPLMSSGVVVNPTTFQPVVSLMTRYGKAVFSDSATSLGNSADYYGKINVVNLDLT